ASPRRGAPADRELPTSAPRSILIVDDMGSIRARLAQHVSQLGHRPSLAADGRDALEQLREKPYDLVLLDIQMPDMDGHAVLTEMKADPGLRDIPVIVVSGVDELDSVVHCIEQGAEDYLHKPFNPTLLRARIGACLEKKRLWDELQARYRDLQE